MTRDRYLERQVEKLKAENTVLRELVDGCMDVVEISSPNGSPAQVEWRKDWMRKAREVMK